MPSKQLGPELDVPQTTLDSDVRVVGPPSRHAYQCDVCGGIAYNPVCPYCNEREEVGQ